MVDRIKDFALGVDFAVVAPPREDDRSSWGYWDKATWEHRLRLHKHYGNQATKFEKPPSYDQWVPWLKAKYPEVALTDSQFADTVARHKAANIAYDKIAYEEANRIQIVDTFPWSGNSHNNAALAGTKEKPLPTWDRAEVREQVAKANAVHMPLCNYGMYYWHSDFDWVRRLLKENGDKPTSWLKAKAIDGLIAFYQHHVGLPEFKNSRFQILTTCANEYHPIGDPSSSICYRDWAAWPESYRRWAGLPTTEAELALAKLDWNLVNTPERMIVPRDKWSTIPNWKESLIVMDTKTYQFWWRHPNRWSWPVYGSQLAFVMSSINRTLGEDWVPILFRALQAVNPNAIGTVMDRSMLYRYAFGEAGDSTNDNVLATCDMLLDYGIKFEVSTQAHTNFEEWRKPKDTDYESWEAWQTKRADEYAKRGIKFFITEPTHTDNTVDIPNKAERDEFYHNLIKNKFRGWFKHKNFGGYWVAHRFDGEYGCNSWSVWMGHEHEWMFHRSDPANNYISNALWVQPNGTGEVVRTPIYNVLLDLFKERVAAYPTRQVPGLPARRQATRSFPTLDASRLYGDYDGDGKSDGGFAETDFWWLNDNPITVVTPPVVEPPPVVVPPPVAEPPPVVVPTPIQIGLDVTLVNRVMAKLDTAVLYQGGVVVPRESLEDLRGLLSKALDMINDMLYFTE